MSRALRVEFPGAVYHVTSPGDRREAIFLDDDDRDRLLAQVAHAMDRFDAQMLAYCLMGNHYHFVVHTRQANLSRLMRHVNAGYSQAFNRRHGLVGHVFQGRFKAIVVDRDTYLMALCRYVELNPVRAGMVDDPADWPWSSYRAHAALVAAPAWLDTNGLHGHLLGHDIVTPHDRRRAAHRYAALVAEGHGDRLWDQALRQQIYLGDDAFIEQIQKRCEPVRLAHPEISRLHRSRPKDWAQWLAICGTREEALRRAYREGGISMSELARKLALSVSRISRLIARAEQDLAGCSDSDIDGG